MVNRIDQSLIEESGSGQKKEKKDTKEKNCLRRMSKIVQMIG